MEFPSPPECYFSEEKTWNEQVICIIVWAFYIIGFMSFSFYIWKNRNGLKYNRQNPKKEPIHEEVLHGMVRTGSNPEEAKPLPL